MNEPSALFTERLSAKEMGPYGLINSIAEGMSHRYLNAVTMVGESMIADIEKTRAFIAPARSPQNLPPCQYVCPVRSTPLEEAAKRVRQNGIRLLATVARKLQSRG